MTDTQQFNDLLEEAFQHILKNQAAIQTMETFEKEMEGVECESFITEEYQNNKIAIQNQLQSAKDTLTSKFKERLTYADPESVNELIKQTKYTSNSPLTGKVFLNQKDNVQKRLKQETAEALLDLAPDKVIETMASEDDAKIDRFLDYYRPKNINSDVSDWISRNISDGLNQQTCREHFEEMQEFFYTEDTLETIADRWIHMSDEKPKEELQNEKKQLMTIFKKYVTVL